MDQCEAGTSKDLFQPTDLGSLGKVNSQANMRDLLSKINYLKWHKSKSYSFSFFSPKCVDLPPNTYPILELQMTGIFKDNSRRVKKNQQKTPPTSLGENVMSNKEDKKDKKWHRMLGLMITILI